MFENIAVVRGLTANEHVMIINHLLSTQVAVLQHIKLAVFFVSTQIHFHLVLT